MTTEQVPSKERITFLVEYWAAKAKSHKRWPEGQGLHAELLGRIYDDTIAVLESLDRLQTTLRGIQSCSTCAACRGAATRALDAQPAKEQRPHRGITSDWNYTCTDNDCWCWASEHHNPREPKSDLVQQMRLAGYHDWASAVERLTRQVAELSIHAEKWVKRALERPPEPVASIRELAASAYKDGYGADLTDDRDLSARTLELMRHLSRPAHEREGPHCSTCECGYIHGVVTLGQPGASGCPCKGHPTKCYRHPHDCGCEPNMLHPKIQALISQKARLEIERNMIAAIIKDGPDADLYGLSDYETELHDQLREKLRVTAAGQRALQPPQALPQKISVTTSQWDEGWNAAIDAAQPPGDG